VCLFVGTTRQFTDGVETLRLYYDSYADMALASMEKLVREAQQTWQLERCCIMHRTGRVEIGEASVVVAVGSAHRGPAFEACRFLIDRLKEEVPVWKREELADGSASWVRGVDTGSSSPERE
jgi:molybdopterin synthase catalytic subunit